MTLTAKHYHMKTKINQLKIKQRQTEILLLLYRFRFLNRLQIQTMLEHKHHSRVLNWLKELEEHKYIKCDYDKKFTSVSAIYYLAPFGRKYLKDKPNVKKELLIRVWREKNYTDEFKEHCLFLCDIYLSLISLTGKTKANLHFYTKTDLYGVKHLIQPVPDAHFAIEEKTGTIKRYFLEILDDLPPKILRRRVNQYFKYFESDEWQDNTDKPFPSVIIICPNKRIQSHLRYYIKAKLEEDTDLTFYLSTKEIIESQGLNKETLQKVMTEA
ncbi:hypothetical protein COY62_03985 [bacterium (Candidatus Howlettbacteria) CG_4_10_14_0_8_um_filter_40_9]|nr:MAG: hypothetical protein COY62_03985 [bacterium (Candidatus Howlettbacteria) CG_4_10_14_0_8_um_filter_40_9]